MHMQMHIKFHICILSHFLLFTLILYISTIFFSWRLLAIIKSPTEALQHRGDQPQSYIMQHIQGV